MAHQVYDTQDHSQMYQVGYNMMDGGEIWYTSPDASMDAARALSRRQAQLSSTQDYHSELDPIDEYTSDAGLTRAYPHAPPRHKTFDIPSPSQRVQLFPALIINGARNADPNDPRRDAALMEAINYAVERLAPAETGELGSNWPYTNSKFDAVQDADFSVNSDA